MRLAISFMQDVREKIIIALDVSTMEELKRLVGAFSGEVRYFKVGLEALTALGAPQVVETLRQAGAKVFFDGKFHDIPNTIAEASKAVSRLGVGMFNVHASSGTEALAAAAQNKGKAILLAVTVLTSLNEIRCQSIYGKSSLEMVTQFARESQASGADGIVCSPRELKALSEISELSSFLKVTPGIRPAWADLGDQKRTLTPAEALKQGADYLVVGRPLTSPPASIGSPQEALKRFLDEVDGAKP